MLSSLLTREDVKYRFGMLKHRAFNVWLQSWVCRGQALNPRPLKMGWVDVQLYYTYCTKCLHMCNLIRTPVKTIHRAVTAIGDILSFLTHTPLCGLRCPWEGTPPPRRPLTRWHCIKTSCVSNTWQTMRCGVRTFWLRGQEPAVLQSHVHCQVCCACSILFSAPE